MTLTIGCDSDLDPAAVVPGAQATDASANPPCSFAATLAGGPSGYTMAGVHRGSAHHLGNAVMLKDHASGWNALIGLPAEEAGSYVLDDFSAAAIAGEADDGSHMVEMWKGQAELEITAVHSDGGGIEGSLTGQVHHPRPDEAPPVSVDVSSFHAVPFGVRSGSAYKRCVAFWNNEAASATGSP